MKHVARISMLLFSALCIEAQWINTSHTSQLTINRMSFVNADSGYVCGERAILKTTDGGRSWRQMDFAQGLSDISFPSFDTGYACGDLVWRTTNGGLTWDSVYYMRRLDQFRINTKFVLFTDVDNGIALGDGKVSYTTSKGNIWLEDSQLGIGFDWIEGFTMPTSMVAYVCSWGTGSIGYMSKLNKTTDGGRTWGLYFPWIRTDIYDPATLPTTIYFLNEERGWYAKKWVSTRPDNPSYDSLKYHKTTDGGETWTLYYARFSGHINTFAFVNEYVGYVGTSAGHIYHTTDGGETWNDEGVASKGRSINAMKVIGGSVVYAVGDGGLILKKEVPVSVQVRERSQPLHIYPNPTTGTLNISGIDLFSSPSALVSITIRDVLGRTLMEASAHDHSTTLDISHIPVGQYIVQVGTGVVLLVKQVDILCMV